MLSLVTLSIQVLASSALGAQACDPKTLVGANAQAHLWKGCFDVPITPGNTRTCESYTGKERIKMVCTASGNLYVDYNGKRLTTLPTIAEPKASAATK